MKKKIIIISSIVVGVILIGLLLFFLLRDGGNNGELPSSFELTNTKEEHACKDDNNCPVESKSIFADISFETSDPKLKNAIDDINKETWKYHSDMVNSNMNDPFCADTKDLFNYSYSVVNRYYFYSNEKYISVGVGRTATKVCNGVSTGIQVKPVIYDKASKTILTQKEFRDALGVTNDMVYKVINDNIDMLNAIESFTINKKDDYDYVLFYNTLGELTISYYLDNYGTYLVAQIIV